MMIKCAKCGFENQLGAIFCRQCGEKIDVEAVSPEKLAEEKKKSETGKNIAKILRHTLGIIVLLAIIGIAGGLFTTAGLPVFEAPEKQEKAVERFKRFSEEGLFILPAPKAEFTMDELTWLFHDYIFKKDAEGKSADEAGGYAVENVMCKAEDGKLAVYLFTRFKGKIPVNFKIVGLPKKGDAANPVQFDITSAKMGYIPLAVAQLRDKVLEKFSKTFTNKEMETFFSRMQSVSVEGDKLVFQMALAGKPVIRQAEAAADDDAEEAEQTVQKKVKKKKSRKKSSAN